IEDGKRIDGVSYEREETYFPDIDNQGGRTPACFDYVCCASKWCTETAAMQAFMRFKDSAYKVAQATAFRRGDGFLAEKVLGRPFTFSTVLRMVEKAQLPPEIILEDAPSAYGCDPENPKIYIVQASTRDGKNFEFSARIARLYKLNYISPEEQCRNSGRTPELEATQTHPSYAGGNYLALCDFLKGKGRCVESESESSLASQEQAATKRQLTPIPVPSTFITLIAIHAPACRGAVTAAVDAQYELCSDSCITTACPAGTVATAGAAAPACVTGCRIKCNLATSPFCLSGSSPVNWDLPAVYPFPRSTSMICAPIKPGDPLPPVCQPICAPKSSYVHVVAFGKQLFAPVHMGIRSTCFPDVIGVSLVAGTFYATYRYPEQARYMNAIASGMSSIITGDFGTCTLLSLFAQTQPDNFALQGSAAACAAISQMKSLKSLFGGGSEEKVKGVPQVDWSKHEFDPDRIKAVGEAANAGTNYFNTIPSDVLNGPMSSISDEPGYEVRTIYTGEAIPGIGRPLYDIQIDQEITNP
ncbi:MAG: hypothetical protein ABH863_01290, partial [Candidatus Micrarchaeota archaeon]